jgi:transcriptional regulator with XRE-family HTH domain
MYLADRLRQLREAKNLSQGDIEKRTGLLRCYVSRVENGHTVPAVETLEKLARALETPLYQLFYENGETSAMEAPKTQRDDWASRGRGSRVFYKFQIAASRMSEEDRSLLLQLVRTMNRTRVKARS